MVKKSKKFGVVSGWIDVPMQVCFRESKMEIISRNGERRVLDVTTPFFRLPDGTEFSGRRASAELREKIARAGKAKGSVR